MKNRFHNYKKGFVLPLILVISFIVLLLAMQRMFFARNILFYTVHMSNHEIAYQAANAGIKAGQAELDALLESINSENREDENYETFKKITEELFKKNNQSDSDKIEIRVKSQNLEELKNSISEIKELNSKIVFEKISSFSDSKKKINEFIFKIRIVSEADCNGVRSQINAISEGRYVYTHLPLIPKFTLFIRQKGNLKIDTIRDSCNNDKIKTLPLIINNGSSLNAGEKLKEEEFIRFIDDQGFIYLGGSSPWEFGISTIGTESSYGDGGISDSEHIYDIDGSPSGLPEGIKYFSRFTGLYRESLSQEKQKLLSKCNAVKSSFSSIINLFGTKRSPSPTLTIGNTRRRYILEQGLYRVADNMMAPFPYLSKSDFLSDTAVWPGNIKKEFRRFIRYNLMSDDYLNYSEHMSQLVTENYNRGVINFLQIDADTDDNNALVKKNPQCRTLERIKINGFRVVPYGEFAGGNMNLINDENEIVYSGNPRSLDLEKYLRGRICYSHKTDSEFFKLRRNKKGLIRLKGIEKINGNMNISKPFVLSSGDSGIICAEGDIRINSGIRKKSGHLYLISLRGDIYLNTTETVNAYIAAPEGTVKFGGGFHLNGGIMMDRFDKSDFIKGKRKKILNYDRNFDITRKEIIEKSYKVVMRDKWDYYVR